MATRCSRGLAEVASGRAVAVHPVPAARAFLLAAVPAIGDVLVDRGGVVLRREVAGGVVEVLVRISEGFQVVGHPSSFRRVSLKARPSGQVTRLSPEGSSVTG